MSHVMKPEEILELETTINSDEDVTIREYLLSLLAEVWWEEESFSGKRPFGNSGWQDELFVPLAKAGLIGGHHVVENDEYEEWADYDEAKGRIIILDLIQNHL